MKTEVVLIFDIGKTNKKILLFDQELKILHEEENIFEEITDEDGFMGDDMDRLEQWILEACSRYAKDDRFILRGINFTTYGASLIYLDENGKRLTPLYNYLKPMPEGVVEPLYKKYGGEAEFCRKTASPALGMLNSGFQALWLKKVKPEIFSQVRSILHLPQYLSFLLNGTILSEHTSIGCHTGLWDFDSMAYHPWTKQLGVTLPEPEAVESTYPSTYQDLSVPVGTGIHDSSSSLVPYLMNSQEEFILVSTGTWCISMNPFNSDPLTARELKKDCLSFLSIRQKPVKSSRLFLGRIHDLNVNRLNSLFGVDESAYKNVKLDESLIRSLSALKKGRRVFFAEGLRDDYMDHSVNREQFQSFEEAYHQLIMDLVDLTKESIDLIIPKEDHSKNIFISGGFSKNPIFLKLIASHFPEKRVYTSVVANATSLGAALVLWKGIDKLIDPHIDLGLQSIQGDPALLG
jgi:sugar (pentulose or hexulose) kinase